MSADLDVQSPELYLGRLEGTAPVAEHRVYSPPGPEQRFVALAAADEDTGARDAP